MQTSLYSANNCTSEQPEKSSHSLSYRTRNSSSSSSSSSSAVDAASSSSPLLSSSSSSSSPPPALSSSSSSSSPPPPPSSSSSSSSSSSAFLHVPIQTSLCSNQYFTNLAGGLAHLRASTQTALWAYPADESGHIKFHERKLKTTIPSHQLVRMLGHSNQ
jgi:hypothetical protein